MEWTIYYVLYLLNKTLKRVNISIIIKVKTFSFEQCITCLSKMSLDKPQGNDQNFRIIPRIKSVIRWANSVNKGADQSAYSLSS